MCPSQKEENYPKLQLFNEPRKNPSKSPHTFNISLFLLVFGHVSLFNISSKHVRLLPPSLDRGGGGCVM